MKNILLIISLLISWNAIAEEKVWYCEPKGNAGLKYESSVWKDVIFSDTPRIIVKQTKNNHLEISKNIVVRTYKEGECIVYGGTSIINCSDESSNFSLNSSWGYATSSTSFGWLFNGETVLSADNMYVVAWKCESF